MSKADDFDMFPEGAANDPDSDADVALITAYLARELTSIQIIAVEERLASDAEFRASVRPIVDAWLVSDDLMRRQRKITVPASLTRDRINSGWQRYLSEIGSAAALQSASALSKASVGVATADNRSRLYRVAAIAALTLLPALVLSQAALYSARNANAPGHGVMSRILAPFAPQQKSVNVVPQPAAPDTQLRDAPVQIPLAASPTRQPESRASAASAQSTPIRMLIPEVTISGEKHNITAAYSFVEAPNGNVIVLGRDEYRGKVFAPNGTLIRNFGRTGEGPGELAFGTLMNAGMVGDTVWIYDPSARRIALFTSDGRPIADVPFRPDPRWQVEHPEWQWLNASLAPKGLRSGGVAFTVPPVATSVVKMADGRNSLVVPNNTGRRQPLILMTWEGRVTGSPITLPIQVTFFRVANNNFQQVFAHLPKYAFSDDGMRMVIASVRDGARPYVELLHLSTIGDTLATHRVSFTPDPISRRSADSVIASWTAPFPEGRRPPGSVPTGPRYVGHERELRDSLDVPRYFRPFNDVMIGNDGTTWLQWHTPGNNRRWLLVSPRGEALMQVEQPGRGSIIGINGAIWGVSVDSVGFLSLTRFGVREGR